MGYAGHGLLSQFLHWVRDRGGSKNCKSALLPLSFEIPLCQTCRRYSTFTGPNISHGYG